MLGVGALHRLFDEVAVGLVVDPLAALFLHDFTLGLDADLFHAGVQHALALQPQSQLQLVGRQHLVVKGAVVGGVGVVLSTRILDVLEEFAAADVLGPFEQEVLEEVGHARAVGVFVLGAYVVHDGHGDDGRAVVFVQDDVKPILEVVFLKFDGGPLGGKGPEDGREAQGQCESHGPVFGLERQDSGRPG